MGFGSVIGAEHLSDNFPIISGENRLLPGLKASASISASVGGGIFLGALQTKILPVDDVTIERSFNSLRCFIYRLGIAGEIAPENSFFAIRLGAGYGKTNITSANSNISGVKISLDRRVDEFYLEFKGIFKLGRLPLSVIAGIDYFSIISHETSAVAEFSSNTTKYSRTMPVGNNFNDYRTALSLALEFDLELDKNIFGIAYSLAPICAISTDLDVIQGKNQGQGGIYFSGGVRFTFR